MYEHVCASIEHDKIGVADHERQKRLDPAGASEVNR